MILKVLRVTMHQGRNTLINQSPNDMKTEKILAVDTLAKMLFNKR